MSQIYALQTTLLPLLIIKMLNSRFLYLTGVAIYFSNHHTLRILQNSTLVDKKSWWLSTDAMSWKFPWDESGILGIFWWEKQMASPNVNNDALCTKLLDLTLPFQLQYYCIYLDIIRTLDCLKLFFLIFHALLSEIYVNVHLMH